MKVHRILDANFNRAREGLRVVEEGARFLWNDAGLSHRIRKLRHTLSRLPGEVPGMEKILLRERDAQKDVGREFQEGKRENLFSLFRVNFKRIEEAERVLEEYVGLISPLLREKLKKIRFETYTLEKEFMEKLEKEAPDFSLYLITHFPLMGETFEKKILKAIKGGAKVIQLREKEVSSRKFLSLAKKVREITQRKALLIINDRVDIAILSGADGVHLGKEDLPLKEARKMVGESFIIGTTVRGVEEAEKAEREGASYLSVGAIYPSPTKPQTKVVGPELIKKIKEKVKLPLLGIGGITRERVKEVIGKGADGVAVISGIWEKEDIEKEVREFLKEIRKWKKKSSPSSPEERKKQLK